MLSIMRCIGGYKLDTSEIVKKFIVIIFIFSLSNLVLFSTYWHYLMDSGIKLMLGVI